MLLVLISTVFHAEVLKAPLGQCNTYPSKRSFFDQENIIQNPILNTVYIEANTGTINSGDISDIHGKVIIQHNETQLNSDHAKFDKPNNTITAQGNAVLSTDNLKVKGNSIEYNLNNDTGNIRNTEYIIGQHEARGKSPYISLLSKDIAKLKQATYSSCLSPTPTWHIQSSSLILNDKTKTGTAKNMTFRVKGVPIFYFPILTFPLNSDRRSGFLTPILQLQSHSNIAIPYYFNLAPNYDATVTTSVLPQQGLKLDNEFRYLTQKNKGIIKYDFIPEDKTFNKAYRDYFKIEHHTKLTNTTRINLYAEGASDKQYFNDLSNSLATSSRSSLRRRLEIVKTNSPWRISAAVQDYQILDSNTQPYAKLPEFKIGYKPKSNAKALQLSADLELVRFHKTNSSAITGTRLDTKVTISKKWGIDAGFIKPSLSIQSTLYSLKNTIGASTLYRTLPSFTLDSGLFFDRNFKSRRGKTYTQTLEPRLFYSFTPFKDQSKFPVFDSSITNYSATTQLFSSNRFTGKDRVGDANQLTFAVSSRIQDRENGKELFSISIGQVLNFSDRRVTLPGGVISTGTRSNLVLELSGRINDNFRMASTILIDNEKKRPSNYEFRLNYQDSKKRIANISFRKLNKELNNSALTQISLSGALPINDKWSFIGSTEQDIENGRNLETLVGFEYKDCCWKSRIVAKRYLTSDNKSYETPIFIEFELKGFGSLGTSARQELKDNIYGYDDY